MRGVHYVRGDNPSDLERVIEFLRKAAREAYVGFDYETNRIRPYSKGAKILTVAISCKDETLAFPLRHRQAGWSEKQFQRLEREFAKFLCASSRKIVHHLAFELEWSAFFYGQDCVLTEDWEDTITQAWVLDERRGALSLDFLCLQYFGINLKAISDLDRNRLDETDLDLVLPYNGLDAKYHRKLFFRQKRRIENDDLIEVYEHMLARVPTMVLTQRKGVPVDQTIVQQFYDQYTKELTDLEAEIAALPVAKKFKALKGKEYRPSAPFDIRYVLTKILQKQLEGGTTEAELASIKEPIVQLTLKWRKANKNRSTYVLPLMPNSETSALFPDGFLHPQIKTTDTRTSRTSSDNPNIQNFPKRVNKVVRSQVSVNDEDIITAVDYAGIQARNVAMESKDPALIDAFWHKYDIHASWCETIAKHYPKWVVEGAKVLAKDKEIFKKYRHLAKNQFVFPTFFGAQPHSISLNLNIPENIMKDIQDEFWDKFPGIKRWHQQLKANYLKTGYVTGLSGVRRRAPIGQNELINSSIQADEAFIVCNAMGRLTRLGDPRFQANIEIHDDLTFIWKKKEFDRNIEVVAKEMLRIDPDWLGIVPLEIEVSTGQDWANLKEVAKFASTDYGHVRTH